SPFLLFSVLLRLPPSSSTLFPYTTLFRSVLRNLNPHLRLLKICSCVTMKVKRLKGGWMMKEKFARWDTLFQLYLKRDWKKIMIWVLGLGLFSSGFIPAFKEIAKGQGLLGMFETLQNPAMISMVGPTSVEVASDYTLGAMYAHEMLLFCGLFAMIISILHVIGHTRKEEDLGLTELVRSFQVGRQANSFAAIAEVVFINVILAL